MQRLKLISKKIPFVIILIGIGCIAWSLFNIFVYAPYQIEKGMRINQAKMIVNNRSIYSIYPLKGDYIGTITMPTLNKVLPIYEGTSDTELKKGVGHFIKSALPGELNNSVISGHRDTVFKDIGKLEIGDIVIIKTTAGRFTYKVIGIKIVEKEDKTIIVPTEAAILTMTTCYPFNYIGAAPDRYIVSAKLIKSE